MYVKILKAARPSYWYSNRIGETFEVFQRVDEDFDYEIVSGDCGCNFISKDDCVVIDEQETEVPKRYIVIERQGDNGCLDICTLATLDEQSTDKFDVAEGTRMALQAEYPGNKYFVVEMFDE